MTDEKFKPENYTQISVPADKARLLFPRNTFAADMTGDVIDLRIRTDAAGIPSIIRKLQIIADMMAIEVEQPTMIKEFADETPQVQS